MESTSEFCRTSVIDVQGPHECPDATGSQSRKHKLIAVVAHFRNLLNGRRASRSWMCVRTIICDDKVESQGFGDLLRGPHVKREKSSHISKWF
jgi:hypothetical protein